MADPETPPKAGDAMAQPRKATIATMLASPRGLWRFLKDPAAPWASKILSVITLLYVVSPIDLIPDWIVPVLGWLDDVGLTAAALAFVAAQAARYANEHPGIAVRPVEPAESTSAKSREPSAG